MRKLSIAFMMAVLLVIALALVTSAVEIPEWTETTRLTGIADKATFGADGTSASTSRVLMSDGKTYPAYYICKDSSTLALDYKEINKISGANYSAQSVVRLEVPVGVTATAEQTFKTDKGYKSLVTIVLPEGLTNIAPYLFKDANGTDSVLSSVVIPTTVKTIGMQAFYRCNSLTELVIPEGVETLGKEVARETKNLKRVVFPSTLKSIGELAFRNSDLSDGIVLPEGLENIDAYAFKASGVTSVVVPSTLKTAGIELFRECASLKTVVCRSTVVFSYMFYDCKAIESVTLENTVEIKERAFYIPSGSVGQIKNVILPETVVSIGEYAFIRQSIEKIVVPTSVETIGVGVFQENKMLGRAVVLGSCMSKDMFKSCSAMTELIVTTKLTTTASNPVDGASTTSFITYYTGDDYQDIKAMISGTERITKATVCSYEDYLAGNYTANKYMLVYSANACEIAFDGHLEDGNPCVVNCDRCSVYGKAERNPVHELGVNLVYVGYDKMGKRVTYCKNDGCEYRTEEDIDALFKCLGLAASTYGDGGIVLGYVVNKEALDEYKSVTGKSVEYGVFACSKSKIGENEVVDEEGKFYTGVVYANVLNEAFEIKIVGFRTEEQKNAKFALGAYVIVSDAESYWVSTMQSSKASEGERYFFTTYNEITN